MLGSNDSKPIKRKGEDKFRDINLLSSYKESKVILCTPATAFYNGKKESGFTSFNIQPERVDTIACIVREVAALYNYPLIDINAVTSTHPEWFLKDCVHPDKKGAEEIAFRVKDAIMSL